MSTSDRRLLWSRQLWNEKEMAALIEQLQTEHTSSKGTVFSGWTAENMTAIQLRRVFNG